MLGKIKLTVDSKKPRFLKSRYTKVIGVRMIKVMVVDDETAMREILKIMLKGFKIIEASNGKEAIELYKKEKPDIVLMDVMMPIMNGITLQSK